MADQKIHRNGFEKKKKKWSVTDNVPNNNFQAGLDALKDASMQKWQTFWSGKRNSLISWDEFFKEYDFFVCPVTYGPYYCVPILSVRLHWKTELRCLISLLQYTIIFNVTGHPCLTIPNGFK